MLKGLIVFLVWSLCRLSFAASRQPVFGNLGMVSADHALASQAGVEILKKGGNAIDAAVATSLALSVVRNQSTGIGGGGFALVKLPGNSRVLAIDYRERAPAKVSPDFEFTERGARSVAVPGNIAGLAYMHKRWGKLPWKSVFQPAIRIARNGYESDLHLESALKSLQKTIDSGQIKISDEFKSVYFKNKRKNPYLAKTLEKISTNGENYFYKGPLAKQIVTTLRAQGGVMTLEDLRTYEVKVRTPVEASFRGYKIFSMPLPSSGGAVLLGVLQSLEQEKLSYLGARSLFVLSEAFKQFFADRAKFFGDPDFMTDQELAQASRVSLSSRIQALQLKLKEQERVLEQDQYGLPEELSSKPSVPGDHGTTHYVAADSEGYWVSATESVNLEFGSQVWVEGTGLILNNTMDDFSKASGQANAFGLVGNQRNWVKPFKRPLSSMSPTLILNSNNLPFAAAGASGGPKIITATTQALLCLLVFDCNAEESVSMPRIHHQWMPNTLLIEKEISEDAALVLQSKGNSLKPFSGEAAVQMVVLRKNGIFEGASDPRKGGLSVGFSR